MTRRPRVLEDPLAVTFNGKLCLNVAHITVKSDFEAALREARRTGREVFVGVALDRREARRVLDDLDDGVWDTTGRLAIPMIKRPRRGRNRKARGQKK